MKLKFSRSTETGARQAKRKRTGLFATARAFDSERPTRVYSLLLPPTGNSTRR